MRLLPVSLAAISCALLAACGTTEQVPSAAGDEPSMTKGSATKGVEPAVVTTACGDMPQVFVEYDGPVAPSPEWLADKSDLVAIVDVAQADECVLTLGETNEVHGLPYAVSRLKVVTVIAGAAPTSGRLTLTQPLGDQSQSREVRHGERLVMFLARGEEETESDRAPIMTQAWYPVSLDQGIADLEGTTLTFRGGLGQFELTDLQRSLAGSVGG